MPLEIRMPTLSPNMTEATLAGWLKSEGEAVEKGEPIAEIETDKATLEVEAEHSGVLGRIVVPAGSEGVAVDSLIALILTDGEGADALDAAASNQPAARAEATQPAPVVASADAVLGEKIAAPGAERIFASPLARRMARQAGLDLAALSGKGPRGRIVKADIERALAEAKSPAVPVPAPVSEPASVSVPDAPVLPEGVTAEPHSTMRKTIAARLSAAKRDIPHFYLQAECDLGALLKIREDLNARAGEAGEFRLSVNDLIVKAAALALKRVPRVNASWSEEAILLHSAIDISVAVATEGGLITPVVRNADAKGLASLSGEIRELAERARAGKLKPQEYTGGGFTITNLGMYGISSFAAIINPPQSCILAVGAAEERAVVRGGRIAPATMMTVTLSVDHRAVDGALGAEFLAAFKAIIEDPMTLML
jgi:pyruvate dehydrogenase E2 component (dihydrolipoamide acetyltransferase)